MSVFIIIFMMIATIFALASLAYVVVDLILEHRQKPQPLEEVIEEEIIEEVIEEEPEEVMPEIVDHIDAEEADEMISDELAMKTVLYESPAGHGKQGIINIGWIDQNFEAGDVVTLAVLKSKGMLPKNVGRMKVLADGILSKPLTIKAESYSVQAIKMIELTGGTVIILRDDV